MSAYEEDKKRFFDGVSEIRSVEKNKASMVTILNMKELVAEYGLELEAFVTKEQRVHFKLTKI